MRRVSPGSSATISRPEVSAPGADGVAKGLSALESRKQLEGRRSSRRRESAVGPCREARSPARLGLPRRTPARIRQSSARTHRRGVDQSNGSCSRIGWTADVDERAPLLHHDGESRRGGGARPLRTTKEAALRGSFERARPRAKASDGSRGATAKSRRGGGRTSARAAQATCDERRTRQMEGASGPTAEGH